jgi:hypothetical protein
VIQHTPCSIDDFADFWDWYYQTERIILHKKVLHLLMILIPITTQLLPLWKVGFVQGFVSKEEATELLKQQKQEGTCIVRFSSQPGSLAIDCYAFGNISHVRVKIHSTGFILASTLYPSIEHLFTKSSLSSLKFVHPNHDWYNGFKTAHQDIEKETFTEEIKNFSLAYDDEIK